MHKAQILLVNADRLAQKSLYEMLCRSGYTVDIVNSPQETAEYLEANLCQIVLADINGSDGTELLEVVRKRAYPPEVVVLTSYGNIETAVKTIRMGAFDYLVKPVEDEKIVSAVERAMAKHSQNAERPISVKRISQEEHTYNGLVGTSEMMNEIYSLIQRISSSKATVLLRGESGSGKRMIARAIHAADKTRRDKPFIEVSCGALPREIIESELFGHTRGAFTDAIADRKGRFELANGGTILLDDIDSFSLEMQVKLLRVLQLKEFERVGDHKTMKVDVRIIASTNQDLEKVVAERLFREDLYYRLNVISISVPPLRERREDIPLLTNYFIDIYARENHKKIKGISEDALRTLINYNWPGNIRQLENIIERASILDTDSVIGRSDLPEVILAGSTLIRTEVGSSKTDVMEAASLKHALNEPEKVFIIKVLKEVGWNKKKAAEKLGVNRTTLYNKLRKHNIASSFKA
ncbi:MAG: sigma-54-dependent Fis family transcriptional regulator [Candidatus Omnitrophica bacterium]|nr:sigma-54-dependent Fis family transcriptional regulator [Candidatus Omnitrophota bacterium]